MRNFLKATAGVVAVAATMFGARSASAAVSEANGVFFVHGTGDNTPPTSAASARQATGGSAVDTYWTGSALAAMAAAPQGGSWSYGAAGYQGAAQDAMTSWGVVADQLYDYYYSGNSGQIYNVAVVTHSNGSNPIRYLLAHPTAVTPKGRTASSVIAVIKQVTFLAGDNKGTPLADKVTSSGSLAAIGNSIYSLFGGSYNNAAVRQQIQANMTTYNGNGTFANGTTPGGVPTSAIYGSSVYALIFSGDANCGGYGTTTALKAAAVYGFGIGACSDGFIGCSSATAVGTVPYGGDDHGLNHNQSRRSCHGVAPKIAAQVHGGMGGTFAAIPADYTVSPAAQACNAAKDGWVGTTYYYGCTSTMKSDTNTDTDCLVSYGGDNGLVMPDNYASTAWSNATNYDNGGAGCSDSWAGDGHCDLCLVAKYGYDAANGGSGPDDCVNKGAGTTNSCYDLAFNGASGVNKIQYMWYTASH